MLILSIQHVTNKMQLAKNIYSADGNTLLAAGTRLTDGFIAKLLHFGVSTVYISDKYTGKIEVDELVKTQTKNDATRITKEVMDHIRENKTWNGEEIQPVIASIIEELLLNHDILYNLVEIRAMNDYHYAHNVAVCILSLMTGIALNYNYQKLKHLGTGALLHDIGKAKISFKILNKNGSLTQEEYAEIKKHPQFGYDILKQCDSISEEASYIAWQHHEKFDGTGYPMGLKGTDIYESARIVALADVYDAMSTDRVYRKRFLSQEVIEYIRDQGETQFDPELSKVFLENIAPFPIGSMVLLNTGEKGIVINVPRDFPARPVIKIIFDHAGLYFKKSVEKDLKKDLTLFITKALKDDEIDAIG
ncbi:MAG TPA: HD-GYP domain-containing protein [Firmicutes bacterium]|jgi:HD-GYP domain-containing protein (c-di-GMP phosphodiesterase class II)|nr:HD-GYP domain-containing protein [Bacillota bacterium]